TDPLNDWTFSQSSTEVVFSAVGTNSLDWNTIYNCWFDCSIQPGAGSMTIDEARIGAGALSVQIQADVPSGLSYAQKVPVGTSCGRCQGTFYELFRASWAFDLAGRSMTMTLNGSAYTVTGAPVAFVPAAGTNLGLALNTQTSVPLPFSLPFPGGSTSSLQVFSPGYVTPPVATSVQLLPTTSFLLQGPPRWAGLWTLLSPNASGNVWYDANASRAILTWSGVPMVTGAGTSTFQ